MLLTSTEEMGHPKTEGVENVEVESSLINKYKYLLFSVIIITGASCIILTIYKSIYEDGFLIGAKELSIYTMVFNTIVLFTAGLTMSLSFESFKNKSFPLYGFLHKITVLLVVVFIANRFMEYTTLIDYGLIPGSALMLTKSKGESIFFLLYYITTGVQLLFTIAAMFNIIVVGKIIKHEETTVDNIEKVQKTSGMFCSALIMWLFVSAFIYLII